MKQSTIQASISSKLQKKRKKRKNLREGVIYLPWVNHNKFRLCSPDDTTVDDVQLIKGPAKKL